MKNGICPKCQSRDVSQSRSGLPDRSPGRCISNAIEATAYACHNCLYVETYLLAPPEEGKIWKRVGESQKGPFR